MGHDITAYKHGLTESDREAIYQRDVAPTSGRNEWLDAYERYKTDVEVAYFRRTMSYYRGPVGDLLYQVLGEKAQRLNGGVSGTGESALFGRDELGLALAKVKRLRAERGDNEADDELEFLQKCIDYVVANDLRDIEIYFG